MSAMFTRLQTITSIFGLGLITMCVLSLVLMGLTSEQPEARRTLCEFGVCFYSEAADWWNNLLYELSSGTLISVVFFWLLVRWPEHKKKQRIKRSFAAQYRTFKIACIENFLAVANGGFRSDLPETLLPLEAFRNYFKQNVGDGKTRWDDVANNMTDYYLDVTLSRMEALREEIAFVMHKTDIDNEKIMAFLKRLSEAMLFERNATRDYDTIKSFLSFFWELFAGWDFIEGYYERDIVEDMIQYI